ncbi:MAG: hypothetical protein ACRDUV_03655, partial [Pseudonocardiaceae bacterium]
MIPRGHEHRIALGVVGLLAVRTPDSLPAVGLRPTRYEEPGGSAHREVAPGRFGKGQRCRVRWQPEPQQFRGDAQHPRPVLQGVEQLPRRSGLEPADVRLAQTEPLAEQGLGDA